MASQPPAYNDYGTQDQFANTSSFSDIQIRHAFIRKVYTILSFQLAITVAFISIFLFIQPVQVWFASNFWISWVLLGVIIAVMIALVCCGDVRRKYPLNLILLGIFTIAESILLGAISASYKVDTVLIAVGITAVVVVGLTIFSFQTKIDFTGLGTYLFVAFLVLFAFSILALIIRSKILNIVYAALGAGLFSMYLVFDTQLMMGGKHKYSISPEEYIIACLNLYLDIINLFLMILRLVGAARD